MPSYSELSAQCILCYVVVMQEQHCGSCWVWIWHRPHHCFGFVA